MERQAKNQEVRAKSMLERIKIQEDIIRRLAMKVRDHETRQSSS
jgi:ribosomal protein S6